jgi:hypothetical protein
LAPKRAQFKDLAAFEYSGGDGTIKTSTRIQIDPIAAMFGPQDRGMPMHHQPRVWGGMFQKFLTYPAKMVVFYPAI